MRIFSRADKKNCGLSYADLEKRYGKSRITLWRWVRAGRLPAPYELGPNTVGFALPEILASEANLKRKAQQQQGKDRILERTSIEDSRAISTSDRLRPSAVLK